MNNLIAVVVNYILPCFRLSPNLSQVAQDFGFTPEEKDAKLGGEIAFGFFMIGGVVSIAVGHLADTMNRCRLFGVIVMIGELSCLGTYYSKTYTQLFISRVFTGISIGGASPIIFSILGDIFSGESRVYVSSCYSVSVSAGVAGGQIVAGFLGPKYGWRFPFLVIEV